MKKLIFAILAALALVVVPAGTANATTCCLVSQHLHTYYISASGGFLSSQTGAVVKVNITTREWSGTSGGLVEQVDGAMTSYDLGDSRVGNVQNDGIDVLTLGSNLLRAECAFGCPANSNGGPSASSVTATVCVSPFGSGAYYTTGVVSFRVSGALIQKSVNSNATASKYSTISC